MTDAASKRARFRELHASGCFVIPNPWDIGSARLLQHLGFAALASTSSGHAWTRGRPDYAVTRDDVLEHLTGLCASVRGSGPPFALALALARLPGWAVPAWPERVGAGPGVSGSVP